MVGGQLLQFLAAHQIGARVADVGERDGAGGAVDQRSRHRRAHPGRGRILDRAPVDPGVCLLHQTGGDLLAALAGGKLLERGGCEPRGELTGLRPAHSVGDGEQRRRAHERVLVAQPASPGVAANGGAADPHAATCKSVWPMRTTSPDWSSRAVVTRAPLT